MSAVGDWYTLYILAVVRFIHFFSRITQKEKKSFVYGVVATKLVFLVVKLRFKPWSDLYSMSQKPEEKELILVIYVEISKKTLASFRTDTYAKNRRNLGFLVNGVIACGENPPT